MSSLRDALGGQSNNMTPPERPRSSDGRYATVHIDGVEAARQRDRDRKQAERDSLRGRIGAIAGNLGCNSRRKREMALAATVVRRRCDECDQVWEARVADEQCPYCNEVLGALR